MTNRVCFSSFDLLHDVPNICGVCASNPPIFRYDFCDGDGQQRAEYIKGFCCASCARRLLDILEDTERKEWTQELAALESMVSN